MGHFFAMTVAPFVRRRRSGVPAHPSLRKLTMQGQSTFAEPVQRGLYGEVSDLPLTINLDCLADLASLDTNVLAALVRRALAGATIDQHGRILRSHADRAPDVRLQPSVETF